MNQGTDFPATIAELTAQVLQGRHGLLPADLPVVGAFWVAQATQFPGTVQKYRNYYLLVRVGATFGGCCVERDQLDAGIAEELAGLSLADLLGDERLVVRIAALDAYLALRAPHSEAANATLMMLPHGAPPVRAVARDEAIASLIGISPGDKVGLIGVVNPLVAAIRQHGGVCLPCDFNMKCTADGLPVSTDMGPILEEADLIIATGMTLSNGSFDHILAAARRRGVPFIVYAQTGSAIAPFFLGNGVSAVSAEPFPFSQFSADPTPIYLYRSGGDRP